MKNLGVKGVESSIRSIIERGFQYYVYSLTHIQDI